VLSARAAGTLALAAGWASTARLDALRAAGPDALFERVADFGAWIDAHVAARSA
jgi:hypothetical protein